jgi:hypothetical protein
MRQGMTRVDNRSLVRSLSPTALVCGEGGCKLSLPQKYLKVVAQLAASGALGTVLLLGSVAPAAADQEPTARQPSATPQAGVAERLAAIRDAMSSVAGAPPAEERLAWGNWWHNGGYWGPHWGNGGWGNWRNGWPNWRNFWRNF